MTTERHNELHRCPHCGTYQHSLWPRCPKCKGFCHEIADVGSEERLSREMKDLATDFIAMARTLDPSQPYTRIELWNIMRSRGHRNLHPDDITTLTKRTRAMARVGLSKFVVRIHGETYDEM